MDVKLVPYQSHFLDLFIQWREQPSSVRHNPLAETTREKIEKMLISDGTDLSDLKKFESYRWFINANDEIVGNVSIKNISHMMSYAEIGYGVSESHQGKGIATAVINLLIQKAFSESVLRKLMAFVHDKNIPSCRALEKNGFKREGIFREHYIINDSPENEVLFGLLKSEHNS